MRRLVDHVLCSLPFEAEWFRERGCNATFVGHPYFDEVRRQQLDPEFLAEHRDDARPLVAILPGSRNAGGRAQPRLLPQGRGDHSTQKCPRHALPSPLSSRTRPNWLAAPWPPAGSPIEVHRRRTPELIHLADCCMAVSGSVSLELLYQPSRP